MGCGRVLFLKSGCSGVETFSNMFVTETLFVEMVFKNKGVFPMFSTQSKDV